MLLTKGIAICRLEKCFRCCKTQKINLVCCWLAWGVFWWHNNTVALIQLHDSRGDSTRVIPASVTFGFFVHVRTQILWKPAKNVIFKLTAGRIPLIGSGQVWSAMTSSCSSLSFDAPQSDPKRGLWFIVVPYWGCSSRVNLLKPKSQNMMRSGTCVSHMWVWCLCRATTMSFNKWSECD